MASDIFLKVAGIKGESTDAQHREEIDVVASYHTNGGAEDSVPVDEVSFTYAQVKVEYRPQRPDGSLGAPITAGWNVKTNEPIE